MSETQTQTDFEQLDILEVAKLTAQKSKQYIDNKISKIQVPSVPEWALAQEKPEYTAEEVGALPADTTIPQEDFVAEYGVTTFQEIVDAHNTGRMCWVKNETEGIIIPLVLFESIGIKTATYQWHTNNFRYYSIDNSNNWMIYGSGALEYKTNKTQTISSEPSTDKYPSEKAVADALKTVLPTVTTEDAGKILSVSAEGTWAAEQQEYTVDDIKDLNVSAQELNYMDGVTSNVQTQLNNKSNTGHTHTANYIRGDGYLNTHPESQSTIIPFIYNDLAFLEQRGGSCKIYQTKDADFTIVQLNEEINNVINNQEHLFDGSPSYAFLHNLLDIPLIIDVTLPHEFQYSNKFYIDCGNEWWAANNLAIYVMDSETENNFTFKNSTDSLSTTGKWNCTISHNDINGYSGFNKIRLVLTGFREFSENLFGGRIAEIGLINYNSKGVAETFISRGGCPGIYGDLIPHINSNINLGSSEKHWQTVYADNIVGALPTVTSADAGKFLRISSEGKIIVEQLTNVSEVGA